MLFLKLFVTVQLDMVFAILKTRGNLCCQGSKFLTNPSQRRRRNPPPAPANPSPSPPRRGFQGGSPDPPSTPPRVPDDRLERFNNSPVARALNFLAEALPPSLYSSSPSPDRNALLSSSPQESCLGTLSSSSNRSCCVCGEEIDLSDSLLESPLFGCRPTCASRTHLHCALSWEESCRRTGRAFSCPLCRAGAVPVNQIPEETAISGFNTFPQGQTRDAMMMVEDGRQQVAERITTV